MSFLFTRIYPPLKPPYKSMGFLFGKAEHSDLDDAKRTFHSFSTLPMELRQMVYSKMPLSERIHLSRASQDAFRYMQHHKVKAKKISLYVEKYDERKSIHIRIDNDYEERHTLNEEMTRLMRSELHSTWGCECSRCHVRREQRYLTKHLTVVRMRWLSVDNLLHCLHLVETDCLAILTEPYGGLAEVLQPVQNKHKIKCLDIVLHEKQKCDIPQKLDLKKWSSWIEFTGATAIQIHPSIPDIRGSPSCEDIDSDFLNCEAIRNAKSVYIKGKMNVDIEQVKQMRGDSFRVTIPPDCISPANYWEWYRRKVKEWIDNPAMLIDCQLQVFPKKEDEHHPEWCLVEFVRKIISTMELGEDFIVYDWDCWKRVSVHVLTVRNVPNDTLLRICDNRLVGLSGKGRAIDWHYRYP